MRVCSSTLHFHIHDCETTEYFDKGRRRFSVYRRQSTGCFKGDDLQPLAWQQELNILDRKLGHLQWVFSARPQDLQLCLWRPKEEESRSFKPKRDIFLTLTKFLFFTIPNLTISTVLSQHKIENGTERTKKQQHEFPIFLLVI